MAATISSRCCLAAAASCATTRDQESPTWTSFSLRISAQSVRRFASLKIQEREPCKPIEIRNGRRETRARYAGRPSSVSEAQSRGDSANPNQSSVQNRAADDENRAQSSHDNDGTDEGVDLQKEFRMARVCDRLIEVFTIEKTTPSEWRNLLAFSEEWPNIRPYFFKRCTANAGVENDPKRRGDLLKLARQLKEVDEDMMGHDELFGEVEGNAVALDAIVARRRKDFTGAFFDHLHTLCNANYRNRGRQDEIAALAEKIFAAVKGHDSILEDDEALGEAQRKFEAILNSPSLEAATNKIDRLAERQELDSALMLVITKAYAAAKESTLMKEEVKDIMFHLYNTSIGNMQRLVPKEVRIIRYLLSIQDPREMRSTLEDAFAPGKELEGNSEDVLYTTPDRLLGWIKIVLDAYRTRRQSTLVKEAQKLMKPEIISRVEEIKGIVEREFT